MLTPVSNNSNTMQRALSCQLTVVQWPLLLPAEVIWQLSLNSLDQLSISMALLLIRLTTSETTLLIAWPLSNNKIIPGCSHAPTFRKFKWWDSGYECISWMHLTSTDPWGVFVNQKNHTLQHKKLRRCGNYDLCSWRNLTRIGQNVDQMGCKKCSLYRFAIDSLE